LAERAVARVAVRSRLAPPRIRSARSRCRRLRVSGAQIAFMQLVGALLHLR
jgi:hypothetical protein